MKKLLIEGDKSATEEKKKYYRVRIEDGSLWAWGLNKMGQLGDGTTVDKHVPTRVGSDGDSWLAAAAGKNHVVAIKADGSLWAWGGNEYGELGNGSYDGIVDPPPHPVPAQIGTDTDWIFVSTSDSHNAAFKTDGSLWLWGIIGIDIERATEPQRLDGAGTWLAVACGGSHTVATLEAGLTVPTVPQNFTATPGDTQVALTWEAPASDGGAAITHYEVSADDGTTTWIEASTGTSHTFTGLTNGLEYTFKVRAVNSEGPGAEASATATPVAQGEEPSSEPPALSETGANDITQTTAALCFTLNKAGTYYYLVYEATQAAPDEAAIKDQGAAVAKGTGAAVTAANNIAVTGLTASTEYKAYLIVEDAEGNISSIALISFTTTTAVPTYALTITAGAGGSITSGSSGNYEEGAVINIAAVPASGYSFDQWTSVGGGTFGSITSTSTTFTMPANAVTITAVFRLNSSGGGGGGGGSTPPAPVYEADVETESGTETTLPVTVDPDAGNVSVETYSQTFAQGGTVISIPSIPGVDTYSVGIPVPDLSTANLQSTLTLNTGAGSISVPSNMLSGVAEADGNKAQISIGQGDKSTLPEDIKTAIGDRPLIQLTLSIDGNQTDWNNPEAPVTVSIPYTPTAAELAHPESIVVWYIDGSGNTVPVSNGQYDPETGTVTFTTTHFSYYAVGYHQVNFKDVVSDAWYVKAVSFIAAREITTGTGSGNFSPEAKLTRGQFIVMLMKAYAIAPDLNPQDNFADAGSTYYTSYLAAAKRLGISAGVGDNMFAPEKEITRQEMFTLLYNALKAIGQLPQNDSGKVLSDFSDAEQIDAWAKDALNLLVRAGIIGGSNGKLSPLNTTTRAEMAQVLYNLLRK